MIKLSDINESHWSEMNRRSQGISVRKEDENPFLAEFRKIQKMELLRPGPIYRSGLDFLWTPCNFGAESPEEPGLYLSREELLELNNLLKGTKYEIMTINPIRHLINLKVKQKKIGGYYAYYYNGYDGKELLIPNFGAYSILRKEIIWKYKDDIIHYGSVMNNKPAYVSIYKSNYNKLEGSIYVDPGDEMKYQVRLVKRIKTIYGQDEYEEYD